MAPSLANSIFARQAYHLGKGFRELAQVQGAERPYRAVGRKVVGAQHAKGHIFMSLPANLAGAKNTSGVCVNQYLDHHPRMKWLVACTVLGVAGMKRAQVQAVNDVAVEVRQVALGQSVLQRMGQQLLLLGVGGHVACTHAILKLTPDYFASGKSLLPPKLLPGQRRHPAAGRMSSSYGDTMDWCNTVHGP